MALAFLGVSLLSLLSFGGVSGVGSFCLEVLPLFCVERELFLDCDEVLPGWESGFSLGLLLGLVPEDPGLPVSQAILALHSQ